MADVSGSTLREEASRCDVVQWGVWGAVAAGPIVFSGVGAVSSVVWAEHGWWWTAALWGMPSLAYIALLSRATPRSQSILRMIVESSEQRKRVDSLEASVANFGRSIVARETGSAHLAGTRAMIAEAIRAGVKSRAELAEVLSELLLPIIVDGELFFGFRFAERWSLSVYLFSADRNELVDIWRDKARTHPGGILGRSLRPGDGHVGQAFLNQRSIITVDATADDVRSLVATPPERHRSWDEDVYRSFASFPIGPALTTTDRAYGVLVATSDEAGRFFSGNAWILEEMAGAIALVLLAANVDFDRLPDVESDNVQQTNTERSVDE